MPKYGLSFSYQKWFKKRVFSRTFSTFPGVLAEAFSSWNWYNYLASKAPPAKRLLRVNIDETSVSWWQGSGKGTIAFARRGDAEHEAHQSVPRRLKRMNMTHVAFICDAADLQPKMPQIFIGNAAIFKVSDIRVLNAEAPDNILFVRQKVPGTIRSYSGKFSSSSSIYWDPASAYYSMSSCSSTLADST